MLMRGESLQAFVPTSAGDDEHGSGRKRKKKAGIAVGGGMRKTRGMLAEKSKGPKTFKDWLDEVCGF